MYSNRFLKKNTMWPCTHTHTHNIHTLNHTYSHTYTHTYIYCLCLCLTLVPITLSTSHIYAYIYIYIYLFFFVIIIYSLFFLVNYLLTCSCVWRGRGRQSRGGVRAGGGGWASRVLAPRVAPQG